LPLWPRMDSAGTIPVSNARPGASNKKAMFVTRKAEFSASHLCRLPGLSDVENNELFGEEANPNGHGHNYILEVTIEGDPNPVTGMVIDIKRVKEILEQEVIGPMDHRFLNYEVSPFDSVVPTAANLAQEIWRRLVPRFSGESTLARLRLYETQDLYVDIFLESSEPAPVPGEELAA
jgi:6-pyruvoyltetrahydropterin/6-carboxytetrahydropterin synthase